MESQKGPSYGMGHQWIPKRSKLWNGWV